MGKLMINSEIITIKGIVDENFQDYKKASMYISAISCDFKCLKEQNLSLNICQNSDVIKRPNMYVSIQSIFERYKNNLITNAIIFAGLEPMLQFDDLYNLIKFFRDNVCDDDFIIYTGYYPDEITDKLEKLKKFKNIIVKFGRFIPNSKPIDDEILGVTLSSENQYAKKLS